MQSLASFPCVFHVGLHVGLRCYIVLSFLCLAMSSFLYSTGVVCLSNHMLFHLLVCILVFISMLMPMQRPHLEPHRFEPHHTSPRLITPHHASPRPSVSKSGPTSQVAVCRAATDGTGRSCPGEPVTLQARPSCSASKRQRPKRRPCLLCPTTPVPEHGKPCPRAGLLCFCLCCTTQH